MSVDWSFVRLKDYCTKIGSGSTPRGGANVYLDSGNVCLIRSQNIYNDGFSENGLVFISDSDAEKLNNVEIELNDVLINITGDSVARVCLAPKDKLPARVNQHVAIIRTVKNELDPKFVRYFLTDRNTQNHLLTLAGTGATRNALTKGMLEEFLVPKPDILIQKKISKILSDLDEKIHLNNQINQTLESIAQTIFKSWFIDFEPVRAKIAAKQEGKDPELAAMCAISGKTQAELDQLTKEDFAELQATAALFPDELVDSELGEVPRGWSVQKIKDFGRVICGKTPSKSIAEYYGNDIPFIKIPDMHHDVFVLDSFEKLSEKGSNSQANKILPRGSICVSCIATVGKVIITHQPSQTNQQINSIVPDLPIYTYFLYFLMGEKERLFHDLASGGSATLNMNTSTFSNVDILMPNSKIIEAYDGVVSRIFDEILHNLKLSFLLSDMRDTLLPKLLSGELDVSDLQSEGD